MSSSGMLRSLGSAIVLFLVMTDSTRANNLVKVMTFNLRYASAGDGDNNWQNSNQTPDRRQVAVMVITNRLPDLIGFQEGEDVQLDYLAASAV